MGSANESIPVPSMLDDEVAGHELTHIAFLSHEGMEKRTVVDLLRRELRQNGVHDTKVFYDDYMKRGGNADEVLKNRLQTGLLASEYMIVFLTPEFLNKRWPMWELRTFLEMMEKDKRRRLLPVFYQVSAAECGDIARRRAGGKLQQWFGLQNLGGWLGLTGNNEELKRVLAKVKEQIGIDAKGLRMSDADVVTRIMRDVFEIDITSSRTTVSAEHGAHGVATCSNPLCDYPACAEAILSNLNEFFSVRPLPRYTRLDFESSERPEKVLRDKLILKGSSTVAAVGVKGMGGVGKTTCLIGVAKDLQVREAFPEGTLWIQLSKETKVEKVREIFVNILKYAWYHWKELNPEVALNPRTSLDDVVKYTREALEEKRCLIVLDDFWPFDNYELVISHFIQILNPWSRILLSTRYSEVLSEFNADQTIVGDLDEETASVLFDDWCGRSPTRKEEENLKKEVLRLCYNVALAVCIAGSNVRRIAKSDGIEYGLKRVLGKLKGNCGALHKLGHLSKDRALNAVIQTSIDSIADEDHKNGYQCLAVFDSKTRIPKQTLEALWDIDADKVEDRVDLYVGCSLATRKVIGESGSTNSFYVEFHDQHLAYARYSWCRAKERLGAKKRGRFSEEDMLTSLHAQLVDGYEELSQDINARVWWESEQLDDGYFHENFIRHLARSGRSKHLFEVVMDYRWIAIRCRRQEMMELLEDLDLTISALKASQKKKGLIEKRADFIKHCSDSSEPGAVIYTGITHDMACYALRLVRKALRASQATLWERCYEAPFQLVGRLRVHSQESPFIRRLIDGARRWEQRSWLCPMAQCFESPMSGAPQTLRSDSGVESVAVVHENRHLVACGTINGDIHLWNWNTGRTVWFQKGHEETVSALAVTEAGSILVSGSRDSTVRLWNVENGKCRSVLRGHGNWVRSVAVTENGSVVVSGSCDNTVRVWNIESAECQSVLRGHEGWVNSVAVTADGSVVVSGSMDYTVRLWNVKSGECKSVLRGHTNWVESIAVTQDGSVVVSGSYDKTVRLWNLESGECEIVLRGHENRVNAVAVTKNGGVVASGSDDKTVRLWNGESGECKSVLRGHDGRVNSVALMEDSDVIVSGSSDDTVRLWNVENGECMSVLQGHKDLVSSIAVTEDGSLVVSGSDDRTVRLWNIETGECKSVLRGHERYVNSVAVTEDGSTVVSGSSDKTVRLWDVEKGECKSVLRGHERLVNSVAVTEDGSIVVSGSSDKTVRLWNTETGECKSVLRGHERYVTSVAITNDGSIVVSGSDDDTVRLWCVESGKCKSVLRGHDDQVNSVAVTESGSIAVSGSQDQTVRLWNAETGECDVVLRGHGNAVTIVAVTEEGSTVVSGSWDHRIRLWDVESGECFKTVVWYLGFPATPLESRDLLRWARLVGLLTKHGEIDFGAPGRWSPLPGGCRVRAGAGLVKVVRNGDDRTMTSATFDSAFTVQSALVINLKDSQRVLVVGPHMFILEIMNPRQLEKGIGFIDEKGSELSQK